MFIIVPCIAALGGLLTTFTSKYEARSLDNIAASGNLAEEVISTIRTAKAFGSQLLLGTLYDAELHKARKTGYKVASVNALVWTSVFFIIYCSYALAFAWGVTLVLKGECFIFA